MQRMTTAGYSILFLFPVQDLVFTSLDVDYPALSLLTSWLRAD